MKITYDQTTDTLTIIFTKTPVAESDEDKPGVIGQIGSQLGAAGVNIINFSLGAKGDGQAVAAITVDESVTPQQLRDLRTIPGIVSLEMM